MSHSQHIAERAREHPRLELLIPLPSPSGCFRYHHDDVDDRRLDEVNTRIVQVLRAEKHLVPSTTAVEGGLAMSPCFINPATMIGEVEALVESVILATRTSRLPVEFRLGILSFAASTPLPAETM